MADETSAPAPVPDVIEAEVCPILVILIYSSDEKLTSCDYGDTDSAPAVRYPDIRFEISTAYIRA